MNGGESEAFMELYNVYYMGKSGNVIRDLTTSSEMTAIARVEVNTEYGLESWYERIQ